MSVFVSIYEHYGIGNRCDWNWLWNRASKTEALGPQISAWKQAWWTRNRLHTSVAVDSKKLGNNMHTSHIWNVGLSWLLGAYLKGTLGLPLSTAENDVENLPKVTFEAVSLGIALFCSGISENTESLKKVDFVVAVAWCIDPENLLTTHPDLRANSEEVGYGLGFKEWRISH